MKLVEPDEVLLRMYDHAIRERNKADARRALAIDSLTAANSSHIEWSAEVNAIWDELCARDLVGGDR